MRLLNCMFSITPRKGSGALLLPVRLIVSEGGATDEKRCTDAFNGLNNWENAPSDDGIGGQTTDWQNQAQAFFVQSCVTGLPKPVPSQAADGPSGSSGSTMPSSATSSP